MSFDIFVATFRNTEPVSFPRSVFDEIFGEFITDRQPNFLRVRYPGQGGGAQVYIDDGPEVDSVMFNHCGGPLFWDGLYQLTRRIDGVIWWPNIEHTSAVTSAETLKHLPSMFVDQHANPTVVDSGQGIVDAIQ